MPLYDFACPECRGVQEFCFLSKREAENKPPMCPFCCNCSMELVPFTKPSHFRINGYSEKNGYSENHHD